MKNFKITFNIVLMFAFLLSIGCKAEKPSKTSGFIYGGDFSLMKKIEDGGGVYKIDGQAKPGLEIFKENGYNYGRVRLFNSPNNVGPVCNSLEYTIALSKEIKNAGMKLLLDFHYSDTWADPAHQIKPKAWENISFEALTDSVYSYSKNVILAMKAAGVLPDMVQVGNEITPGFIWPDGKIYTEKGENWVNFCTLLKAGIRGVKDAYGGTAVPIMIHIDKGGDQGATEYFFRKITEQGVEFDIIGQSYYPWWHGSFADLEKNLAWMSANYNKDIIIVETAYHANGFYPEPDQWVLDIKPFPPTPEGQYDYLVALDSIARKYPKVKGIFYWEPDGILISDPEIYYLGRSLFDEKGNAHKGIKAFKKAE
ncbi:MAG TPA: glycosyl hydrolase 53 family protein [Prolixibacteraceae bacterium]|nr:glycosyl hydrolase 53 family protein [Prolixibacteraceae bacterium]HPS13271.1 glycosyl hydrolase 53 family protein [Prolixibacteraceae bacterium]